MSVTTPMYKSLKVSKYFSHQLQQDASLLNSIKSYDAFTAGVEQQSPVNCFEFRRKNLSRVSCKDACLCRHNHAVNGKQFRANMLLVTKSFFTETSMRELCLLCNPRH